MKPMISGKSLVFGRHLVAIAFEKNSSPNFNLVLGMCQEASAYAVQDSLHIAVFSAAEAERALVVLNSAKAWRSLKVFLDGKLQFNAFTAVELLECYLSSQRCNDWRAHCFEVIAHPRNQSDPRFQAWHMRSPVKSDRYVFPCKRLLRSNFKLDPSHPSSDADQVQAFAVKLGCESCPNFNPQNFRKVESQ